MANRAESLTLTPSTNTNKIYGGMGAISMLGILALLVLITLVLNFSWTGLFSEIATLFLQGPQALAVFEPQGILYISISVIAVIFAMIVCSLIISSLTNKVLGKSKSYHYDQLQQLLDKGPFTLFVRISVEEVIARGLFLGILLPALGGSFVAFWILFILGNALFAIVHLLNFEDKADRSILRILPQFVGGIALTYIFMRWGFGVAILAHFYYDVVILSSMKEQRPNKSNIVLLGYYLVLGAISFILISSNNVNVFDLNQWVMRTGEITPISGYTGGSYILVLLLIDSIIAIVGELLLLDDTMINQATASKILWSPVHALYSILITVFIILGLNFVLSYFINETLVRAVIVTVFMALTARTYSGSSLARATLIGLPGTFFAIAAFSALGFWAAVVIMVFFHIAHYVPLYIRSQNVSFT